MGRRYGRNQKRRHRQRIKELEEAQTRLVRENTDQRHYASSLRAELKMLLESIDAVAPLSVILKPKLQHVSAEQLRYGPFESMRRKGYRPLDVEMGGDRALPLERVQHWLYEVVAHIRTNPQDFETAIHLVARSPRGEVKNSYFISMEGLRHLERHPEGFKMVFEKLAREVAAHLREKQRV